MSETYLSLSHSKWDCKNHVVFVPKRRRKAIFGQTRRQLGAIFHALARQKECHIAFQSEHKLYVELVRDCDLAVECAAASAVRFEAALLIAQHALRWYHM